MKSIPWKHKSSHHNKNQIQWNNWKRIRKLNQKRILYLCKIMWQIAHQGPLQCRLCLTQVWKALIVSPTLATSWFQCKELQCVIYLDRLHKTRCPVFPEFYQIALLLQLLQEKVLDDLCTTYPQYALALGMDSEWQDKAALWSSDSVKKNNNEHLTDSTNQRTSSQCRTGLFSLPCTRYSIAPPDQEILGVLSAMWIRG